MTVVHGPGSLPPPSPNKNIRREGDTCREVRSGAGTISLETILNCTGDAGEYLYMLRYREVRVRCVLNSTPIPLDPSTDLKCPIWGYNIVSGTDFSRDSLKKSNISPSLDVFHTEKLPCGICGPILWDGPESNPNCQRLCSSFRPETLGWSSVLWIRLVSLAFVYGIGRW